mmetsp:Transcript_57211/g.125172  ORF Transcript_57211/g.125172 Transcript_57211/m.125172 type:complete len:241 (-) Transcript_57211:539-1261(-)
MNRGRKEWTGVLSCQRQRSADGLLQRSQLIGLSVDARWTGVAPIRKFIAAPLGSLELRGLRRVGKLLPDPGHEISLNLRVGLLLRSYGVAPRREAQQGVGAGPSFVDVHEVGKSASVVDVGTRLIDGQHQLVVATGGPKVRVKHGHSLVDNAELHATDGCGMRCGKRGNKGDALFLKHPQGHRHHHRVRALRDAAAVLGVGHVRGAGDVAKTHAVLHLGDLGSSLHSPSSALEALNQAVH